MPKIPFNRRRRFSAPRGPRRNERIRAREVRVISPEGQQVGVMPTSKALQLAKEVGFDLVEISASSNPPVCRILDYGKYMYDQSKKKDHTKSSAGKLKEVKFRVRTGEHDYMTKLRHAEEFLDKGNKVKLTLTYRGRENEHKELGFETINRAIKDLSGVGVADAPPRLMGRNLNALLSPLPVNKRKLRFNLPDEEDSAPPPPEKAKPAEPEPSDDES